MALLTFRSIASFAAKQGFTSVRRAPKALDRGTNTGVDQPLPSPCARLRAARPQGGCLRAPRDDPPHAASSRSKPLITNPNFPDRLSGYAQLLIFPRNYR